MVKSLHFVIDLGKLSYVDAGVMKSRQSFNILGYESNDRALLEAAKQASSSVGAKIAVLTISHIYESLEPTVVAKKFNEDGELVNL